MQMFGIIKARDIQKMLERHDIKGLVGAMSYRRDHQVRKAAAKALAVLGKFDSRAMEPLIQALSDQDKYVRIAVAEALGEQKDVRAVEPLIEALGYEDCGVKKAAAWALGQIRDIRAVEPLIKAFQYDLNNDVKQTIVDAFVALKDPRAVEPLFRELKNTSQDSYSIKDRIIDAMVELAGPHAIDPLSQFLLEERDRRNDEGYPAQVHAALALLQLAKNNKDIKFRPAVMKMISTPHVDEYTGSFNTSDCSNLSHHDNGMLGVENDD